MNYHRGAATGVLDDATRRALFQFQVDRGLSGTGNLDGRTAQALGLSLDASVANSALSSDQASNVRRDAQSLVARLRSEMGLRGSGRIDPSHDYAQADLERWFAQSAFVDNASLYEQVVRTGGNANVSTLAGRSLVNAARRVDAAMRGTHLWPGAVALGWRASSAHHDRPTTSEQSTTGRTAKRYAPCFVRTPAQRLSVRGEGQLPWLRQHRTSPLG